MDSIRLAKVAAVHPQAHAVDLVFMDTGSRIPMVSVMSSSATTNTGLADLPEPTVGAGGDKWDLNETKDRDMIAVVGFFHQMPLVLGFIFPEVCQMTFADKNRRVNRHASDVYTSIDKDGNTELYHPSGTYLRIGTASAHEDLTGQDFDGRWKISKNTDKAVHVHLEVKNAGALQATLDIDPSGNVSLSHAGNLTVGTDGNTNITAGGNVRVEAAGSAVVEAGTTIALGTAQEELLSLLAETLQAAADAICMTGFHLSTKSDFEGIRTRLLTIMGSI